MKLWKIAFSFEVLKFALDKMSLILNSLLKSSDDSWGFHPGILNE